MFPFSVWGSSFFSIQICDFIMILQKASSLKRAKNYWQLDLFFILNTKLLVKEIKLTHVKVF